MSIILKPTLGSQLNLGHRLSQGLVGHWLLNEGSGNIVSDLSGSNPGILVGDTNWVPGKFGSCLDFGAVDDIVDLIAYDWTGLDEITVSIWMKGGAATPAQLGNLCRQGSSSGNRVFYLRWDTGQNIDFGIYNSSATFYRGRFNDGVTDTEWHHILGTLRNGIVYVYVDGVVGSLTGSFTGTLEDGISGGQDQLHFGAGRNSAGTISGEFLGQLDIPTIWNRGFSESEIASLYREPFAMFDRMPIELWVGATSVGVAAVGQPTMRRWANIPHMSYLGRRSA